MVPRRGVIVRTNHNEQEQEQPTTIQNQLVRLLSKMDRLEEMVNVNINSQHQTNKSLDQIQRTLGIPPSSTATNNNSSDNLHWYPLRMQNEHIAQHHHHQQQSRQQQQDHRLTLDRNSTSSSDSINRETSSSFMKLSSSFLPREFIKQPCDGNGKRIFNPRSIHYINALTRLLSSSSTRSDNKNNGDIDDAADQKQVNDVWDFLLDTVDKGIQSMKNKTPYEKRIKSWSQQDDEQCDQTLTYVINKATHRTPSIPIGSCEQNWIARSLVIKRWNNVAASEKKRRKTGGAPRKSRRRR